MEQRLIREVTGSTLVGLRSVLPQHDMGSLSTRPSTLKTPKQYAL